MKEIGKEIDLSESRVCQLHSRAIAEIKMKLKARGIEASDFGVAERTGDVLTREEVVEATGYALSNTRLFPGFGDKIPVSEVRNYLTSLRSSDDKYERLKRFNDFLKSRKPIIEEQSVPEDEAVQIRSKPREVEWWRTIQDSVPKEDISKYVVKPRSSGSQHTSAPKNKPKINRSLVVSEEEIYAACEIIANPEKIRGYVADAGIDIASGVDKKAFERIVLEKFSPRNGLEILRSLGYSGYSLRSIYRDSFDSDNEQELVVVEKESEVPKEPEVYTPVELEPVPQEPVKPKDRYVARLGTEETVFDTPRELDIYIQLLLREGTPLQKIKTYMENGDIFKMSLVGWQVGK